MTAKVRYQKFLKKYTGLLYLAPWLIGLAIFQLVPVFATLFYSFTDYNMFSPPEFVGFDNYIKMFTNDPKFYQSLKVTFIYSIFAVPLKLTIALLVALILNAKIKFIGVFRTIYYLPSILGGSIAISILWKFLFMKEGVINNIIGTIGLGPFNFLGNPDLTLYTVSLITVWQFGSSMVIFLAGLKQIPNELYEAAKVDGSGKVRTFFNITLPILSPIILFNLIMQMINALQDFSPAFVVGTGGPNNATYLYSLYLYQEGFGNFRMGYASALSWFLFMIIMLFTLLIFISSKKWVFYEDGGK